MSEVESCVGAKDVGLAGANTLDHASAEERVREFQRMEQLLLERLRDLGVQDCERRRISLHFSMPTVLAARQLVEVLQGTSVERAATQQAEGESGRTSVTIVIKEAIERVVSPPYSGFLLRLATHLDGVYDGWETTLKGAASRG